MNKIKSILIWLPIMVTLSQENEIKMIVDVLQSLHQPTHVIANLCWKPVMKKQLTSDLAIGSNGKSIKFTKITNTKDVFVREKNIFLVDLACPGIPKFLQQANTSRLFVKPYRWFVMGLEIAEKHIPSELSDLDILPDSEVYMARCNQNDSCNVDLVYKIKPRCDWIIENYGYWTAGVGFVKSKHVMEMSLPMRRKNLALETIATSVVITDNSTFDNLYDLKDPDTDSISKIGHRQLSCLYDFINASRKIIYTDTWGYYINGTWTGMLGYMVQGEAELSGTIMFMNKNRISVAEYLIHPTPATVTFIFREPPLSYQNNLYLLPFKGTVWYCVGSFVIIMIGAMYINAYWEKTKFRDEEDRETSMLIPKIGDVAMVVMSAITQQGSTVELKGALGRFVIFVLFLMFLFLYTAYSASIVVLLQSSSDQIRTLSDLLYSKLELGVEDTPYNRYLFTVQKEPVRKAIYEKKIAPKGSKPNFFNLEEGIRHLQKTPFAFHCNQGSAYRLIEKYFYEHEKCGLREILYYQDIAPWLTCRKESPYKEIFKIGLYRIMEAGLNDRTNRLIFSKKPICSAQGSSFVSVSLVDCYPVLLLLLYGILLGVVILFAEILHHRRSEINRKDWSEDG